MYKLDEHVVCAVAGLASDANLLLSQARVIAQRYLLRFGDRVPVETLVTQVCDYKHVYTQTGGLRPFGVSIVYAGWDEHHGFQLYLSDPSGNYGGWKAAAVGKNSASCTSILKDEYTDALTLAEGIDLCVKVLLKALDTSSPSADRVDVATLVLDDAGRPVQRVLGESDVAAVIDRVKDEVAKYASISAGSGFEGSSSSSGGDAGDD